MRACTWTLILGLTAACGDPGPPAPAVSGPVSGTVASADGLPVAWTSRGAGSPTLLFVHGWSCDQGYWREQVDAFAGDRRVVTLDLGGHGASGTDRVVWTLESLAEDVVAVTRTLDLDDVILVGHSMGAPVSLLAAAAVPDRVLGIVAVDALHDVEMEIPPELWAGLIEQYRSDWDGTCDRFVRSMFLEGADAGLLEETIGDMCAADPGIAIALFKRFPTFDARAAMSAVSVPVRATNAAGFPTAVESNRAYADYDAVVVEGAGHFLFLEGPEAFNRLLDTELRELGSSAP